MPSSRSRSRSRSSSNKPTISFLEYNFSKVIVINCHGISTQTTFDDVECGIITTVDYACIYSSNIATGNRFNKPAYKGVLRATQFRRGEEKTGREILTSMCDVREKDSSFLSTNPSSVGELSSRYIPERNRSITSSCNFTGKPPGSTIDDMQLFCQGGYIEGEGCWQMVYDEQHGIFLPINVSSMFGLKTVPVEEVGEMAASSYNTYPFYDLKKKELEKLAKLNEELDHVDPEDTTSVRKLKKKISRIGQRIKNYMLRIEANKIVTSPYVYDSHEIGGEREPIYLQQLIANAKDKGFVDDKTVIILLACRSIPGVFLDFGEPSPSREMNDLLGISMGRMGGRYDKKSRKKKCIKSRKIARHIRHKNIKKVKTRKYKK
jgi:hypothetical protein